MEGSKRQEVRWGILGTANIAKKFVKSVKAAGQATIVAVSSRSLERAQEWANEQGIARAYGTYEELLKDPEVDAVYIPTPTHLHESLTIAAAQHKKHVLCEKPLACDVGQVVRMIAACKANNVQLMDGTMWTHHKRTERMKEEIAKLGKINRVVTCLTISDVAADNIRMNTELEPMGALGDLGWYNVRALQMAYGETTLPERVWASTERNENGVIMDFTGVLFYPDGSTASLDCSFNKCIWRQWLEVNGTQGSLHCDDLVCPWNSSPEATPGNTTYDERTSFTTTAAKRPWEKTKVEVEACLAEVELVKAFNEIVRKGELQQRWVDITLHNQIILDALLEASKTEATVYLKTFLQEIVGQVV